MDEIKNEDIHNICHTISKKIILPSFRNLKETDLKRKKNAKGGFIDKPLTGGSRYI